MSFLYNVYFWRNNHVIVLKREGAQFFVCFSKLLDRSDESDFYEKNTEGNMFRSFLVFGLFYGTESVKVIYSIVC